MRSSPPARAAHRWRLRSRRTTTSTVHVVHDERVAGFVALGIGLDGVPAVLLCTSGTAAANFHAAVVEAGLSAVPMLVLTSDRPPELRDVGAPQTIDQTHLSRRSVRWFHDPGVPDVAARPTWRSLAFRATNAARRGPVHLNLPFREPLTGTPGELPPRVAPAGLRRSHRRRPPRRWTPRSTRARSSIVERGVIVAGGRSGVPPSASRRSPRRLVGPCSPIRRAAPASCQRPSRRSTLCSAIGSSPTRTRRKSSCASATRRRRRCSLSGSPARRASVVQVGGPGVVDPDHDVALVCAIDDLDDLPGCDGHDVGRALAACGEASAGCDRGVAGGRRGAHRARRRARRRRVAPGRRRARRRLLDAGARPRVVRRAARASPMRTAAPTASTASCRPPSAGRWRARRRSPSSATSRSCTTPTRWSASRSRAADLRIVVVDNDGGGIFSFLPQATALPADQFETLFGTPHGTDIEAPCPRPRDPGVDGHRRRRPGRASDPARPVARPRPDQPRRQRRRPQPSQRRRRRRPQPLRNPLLSASVGAWLHLKQTVRGCSGADDG